MTSTQLILLGVAILFAIVVLWLLRRSSRTVERGLADRMEKTRAVLGGRLHTLFGSGRLDAEFWEGVEEALIATDVGVVATQEIVSRVRDRHPDGALSARDALREEFTAEFGDRDRSLRLVTVPAAVVVVGVNGTGKTTSIAKLAAHLAASGKTCLLGAADTFRAAAGTQLRIWAERLGAEIVSGQSGADPASVAFDAYEAARARGTDVVIIDTAGRLHSKHNLMEELSKVVRVVDRAAGAVDEVLLVIDATTGQNAISQARTFSEAVGVTGIILTKLDGTARGGVAVAVERELDLPVKFIGTGEGLEDLIPFAPSAFVKALLEDV